MSIRFTPAIAIASLLVACSALLIFWQYRRGPVVRVNALRARAAQGDAKAQFDVGSSYYYGRGIPQDYAEALRWYMMAADQGQPRAEDALGYMYLNAQGVPQDNAKAFQCYKRAAEHGYAKGQFDLATLYNDGIGVAPDYIETNRWLHKAADQNYAKAQDGIGYMYYAGRGVPQDHAQALFWYRKAAEQGYAKGEFDLAAMYYKGLGTSQDYAEARRWCIKAAKQGNEDAKQALAVFGTEPTIVTKLEYVELAGCLLVGLWSLMDVVLHGRKLSNLRRAALVPLGLACLGIAGMNVYVIAQGGVGYCTYPVAFRIVRRVLGGIAVLIIVTVVLPAKKLPDAVTAR